MKRPLKGRFLFRLPKQKSENKIALWQQQPAKKVTKVIKVPEGHLEVISSPQHESQPTALSRLKYANPQSFICLLISVAQTLIWI